MSSKDQRRRQLAREKFERQQQRRAEARKKIRRRNSVIAVAAAVAVAVGAGAYAGGLGSGTSDDSPSASPSASAGSGCRKAAAGKPATARWKTEPALTIDRKARYTFTLDTTCGVIPISLDAAEAPHTANSFAFLAGKGFFDHTRCHRLVTAGIYVLQCGDPTGTGTGGPGYTLPDENLTAFGKAVNGTVTYPAGTVAMANTGQKHTGGSQFFLVYRNSPLPPSYTPFGTVGSAGMKVLRKIAAAGESTGAGDGAPNADVVIDKATVKES